VISLDKATGECSSQECWDDLAQELQRAMSLPAGVAPLPGVVLVSLCSGLCAAESAVAVSMRFEGVPVNAMICLDPHTPELERLLALEALERAAVHVPVYVAGPNFKPAAENELRAWGPRVNAVFAVNWQIPAGDELSLLRLLPLDIPYVYTFNQGRGVTASLTVGQRVARLQHEGAKAWTW
jgi:hypothetical protein